MVNNKIFLKIGALFVISILSYLFFIMFFLSPKVSNYLVETEIKNTKIHFNKLVSIIDEKSDEIKNKDDLKKEIENFISTMNEKEFSPFIDGINSVILETSIILFIVLLVIGIFITIKIIVPLNKIFHEIKEVDILSDDSNNVKAKDEIGNTPLMVAVERNNLEAVKFLLEKGAAVSSK